jgi:penicillin-binding protein 1A
LSVYTTLDLEAQSAAHEILYDPTTGYLPSPENPDAALVSIEPETGHITAMVGDRDEEAQFNLVTQAQRQPGSSFKPFALIAALEQGLDPAETRYVSEEKWYTIRNSEGNPEKWEVENYEGDNLGPTSLQEALWFSDNSVFTDLVLNVDGKGLDDGPEAIADVAQRLGVTAELDTSRPSIVLGAQEVSPMDMTTAYATIANGGRKVTPTAIKKVVQNENEPEEEEVLYREEPGSGGEQVIDPEVARRAQEIMIGDVTRGIGYKANLGERPAAGKSGTSENFFDSWFIGFTPQLTTGVWMGYAEGGETLDGLLNLGGEQLGPLQPPTTIFQTYMRAVLEGEPVEKFEGIDGAQTIDPNRAASLGIPTTAPAVPASSPDASPTGPAAAGVLPADAGTAPADTASPQGAPLPGAAQYGTPGRGGGRGLADY